MNHLLTIAGLHRDQLEEILHLATVPVERLGRPLAGRGVALIFEKPSNRTRHSTEMAVVQLGGHPVTTRGDEVGLDVREPVEDVARVLSGYHALLGARVFDHDKVVRMAASAAVPVLNLLSDHDHPLQALADVLTMRSVLGDLRGRTMAFVGDWANVARSTTEAAVMLGMHVRLGCPAGYDASSEELARLDALGPGTVEQVADPARAVEGAAVVHTDTWTSMGLEAEKAARQEALGRYQVNAELMARAAAGAWFMHCLPAYRGLEVSPEVIDGPRSLVVAQSHHRMHTARGAIAHLLGVRP